MKPGPEAAYFGGGLAYLICLYVEPEHPPASVGEFLQQEFRHPMVVIGERGGHRIEGNRGTPILVPVCCAVRPILGHMGLAWLKRSVAVDQSIDLLAKIVGGRVAGHHLKIYGMTEDTLENGRQASRLSPSQYMRGRRPHLFSDSKKIGQLELEREVLSHHLETLTKQNAEKIFEAFAKRLAEKFIAPNLRPQTGPAGGGDGKTDAESFPVAKEVSNRWFIADVSAGSERRAFAFSAKEDWRDKVQSDVKEIAGTGRDYDRIYFITNQYAPSRKSAEVQDKLQETYSIPVTILDRTWLLDCVFDRDSLDIAHETLGVGKKIATPVQGPCDLARQTELDRLDHAMNDGAMYQGQLPTLAEDALRAATLARGLERNRYEVDGRFDRAVRLAKDNGLKNHHLMAVYTWAWTSYWWFEDSKRLTELYDRVESLAISSQDADDLERLTNLLPLLTNAVDTGMLTKHEANVDKRRENVVAALEAAKADTSRPNNSLHAHALLLLSRVTAIRSSGDAAKFDGIWDEFTDVIKQSHGLGTFPFEMIGKVITELGVLAPDSEAFDRLYETLTDAMAERQKEGAAATLNSKRGYQKLEKGLHYDAIRWFGRAVGLLVKAEYEDELVEVLRGCSIAYMEAGLYWAGRNYALAAVTNECRKFKQSGSVEGIDPSTFTHWFECELQLGRVPFALTAYELGATIRHGRSRTDEQKEFAEETRIEQGHRLAAFMIATEFGDLPALTKLPPAVDRLGLLQVSTALLFLLGGDEALRGEDGLPETETPEMIESLFSTMAAAGRDAEFVTPDYLLKDQVQLRSRVLGCSIAANCRNSLTSIGIGEALLGALESLLATSLNLTTLPNLDRMEIRVVQSDDAPLTPVLSSIEERGSTVAVVTHRPRLTYANRDEAAEFYDWLAKSVMQIFVTFAVPAGPEVWGDAVLDDESGFSRAITFSNVPTMYGVIFGGKEKISIDDWNEDGDKPVAFTRKTAWSPKLPDEKERPGLVKFGKGQAPEVVFDLERKRHTDYRIVSPIDTRKWDAAVWCATFYMCSPGSRMIPILGLTYENAEHAAGIFEAWRERFGDSDPEDNLRIAIITGVNISNPNAYAVVVGRTWIRSSQARQTLSVSLRGGIS